MVIKPANLKKPFKKHVQWSDGHPGKVQRRQRCNFNETFDEDARECKTLKNANLPHAQKVSLFHNRIHRRNFKVYGVSDEATDEVRQELREMLGEVILEHNAQCVQHGGEDACLAKGCLWKAGGVFRSGQCVGSALDPLRLSNPPKQSDIVRLDALMLDIERTPERERTGDREAQLQYLKLVKRTMERDREFYANVADRLRVMTDEIKQRQEHMAALSSSKPPGWMQQLTKSEQQVQSLLKERDSLAKQFQNALRNAGAYMATVGLSALKDGSTKIKSKAGSLLHSAGDWMQQQQLAAQGLFMFPTANDFEFD